VPFITDFESTFTFCMEHNIESKKLSKIGNMDKRKEESFEEMERRR
jgi:hypothetical protein